MGVFICQGCGNETASWSGKCANCGTTEIIKLSEHSDKMLGRVINKKFKIIKKLGQGGMGAVYLAEQVGIGHRLALKFLKAEFSNDADIARRFLNEAKAYGRVTHPNAVTFHEFGQDDDGNLYIAMEYCEGVDLKKLIAEQRRLPVTDALEIVLQVCEVLSEAHSKGIIHRDLKPENIMIRQGLRGLFVKVLDFGIARVMGDGTKLTIAGSIAGTPRYMSPEQVEGKEVDLRADVYATGIVLYECITGKQPMDGMSVSEILRKQVLEPMPTLVSAFPEADYPNIEIAIQRACAKAPEDRFPDMVSFATQLSQAMPTLSHRAVSRPALATGTNNAVGGDADTTAATMIRSETAQARAAQGLATPPPAAPAGTPKTPEPMRLQTAVIASPAPALTAPSVSMISPLSDRPGTLAPSAPPRSKGPMLAVGAVAAALLLGGGYALFGGPKPPPVVAVEPPPRVPPPEPVKVDPVKVAPTPVNTNDNALVTDVAVKAIKEETARGQWGRARAAFDIGNLGEAKSYLLTVEEGTSPRAEADKMRDTIGTIEKRLEKAAQLKANGQCAQALPLYQEVLRLNPKVADALSGKSYCDSARPPAALE